MTPLASATARKCRLTLSRCMLCAPCSARLSKHCLLTLQHDCLVFGVCQHLRMPLPWHNACHICCSHASLERCMVAAGLCGWDIPIFCDCVFPANLHGAGCCCHGLTGQSSSSATPLSPADVPCHSVLLSSCALPCPALPCPALPCPVSW